MEMIKERDIEEQDRPGEWHDKVRDRQFSDKLDIFKNPRHLDLRWLRDMLVIEAVTFTPTNFNGFPLKKIVDTIGTKRSFIFENVIDGFSIRTDEKGIKISSRNTLVKEAIARTSSIEDPAKRIRAFLKELVQNNFTITKIGERGNFDIDGIIKAILATEQPIYVKPNYSARGSLVIRIARNSDGNVEVQSDDERFAEYFLREKLSCLLTYPFSKTTKSDSLPPGRIRSSVTGECRFAIKAMPRGSVSWPLVFSEAVHAEGTISSHRVYANEVLDGSRQG